MCMYFYTHIHAHMCMYIYIYRYTHTHIYICVYKYIYIYMCVFIHRNPQASQRPGSKAARNTPENPTHPNAANTFPRT